MSNSGETSGSKPLSLRERTASATAAHIREELAPVIRCAGGQSGGAPILCTPDKSVTGYAAAALEKGEHNVMGDGGGCATFCISAAAGQALQQCLFIGE